MMWNEEWSKSAWWLVCAGTSSWSRNVWTESWHCDWRLKIRVRLRRHLRCRGTVYVYLISIHSYTHVNMYIYTYTNTKTRIHWCRSEVWLTTSLVESEHLLRFVERAHEVDSTVYFKFEKCPFP